MNQKTTSNIPVERYYLGYVLNDHNRHTRCHKLNWGARKVKKWKRSILLRAQERLATLILIVTSGLRITRARQVYNWDTETGSWKFVLQLRTIRMRKMCQSQQFVTWDTGCRLLSHARSKYVLSKLLLLQRNSGSNFCRKKLKTLGLIAITHQQKYNLFLINPALSC